MPAIKSKLIAALLVAISSLVILMAANLLFVHFSPRLANQAVFPRALVDALDGCYRAFYPSTHGHEPTDWTAVIGDSHAAGEGDEFLGGTRDYGLVHKLRQRDRGNYLVFARSGFGSIDSAREMVQCLAFMKQSALLAEIKPPRRIIVLFYEGDDLNDNNDQLSIMARGADVDGFVNDRVATGLDTRRKLALYVPVAGLVADGGRGMVRGLLSTASAQETTAAERRQAELVRLSTNKVALERGRVPVPPNPQSAAMELSAEEMRRALLVFYRSVMLLKERFPAAAIEIAYLPSPVTVYDWVDGIRVRIDGRRDGLTTTAADNLRRSVQIRRDIEQFAQGHGIGFVDTTAALRRLAKRNLLHGPRDWKHFNRLGYQAVAESLAP